MEGSVCFMKCTQDPEDGDKLRYGLEIAFRQLIQEEKITEFYTFCRREGELIAAEELSSFQDAFDAVKLYCVVFKHNNAAYQGQDIIRYRKVLKKAERNYKIYSEYENEQMKAYDDFMLKESGTALIIAHPVDFFRSDSFLSAYEGKTSVTLVDPQSGEVYDWRPKDGNGAFFKR